MDFTGIGIVFLIVVLLCRAPRIWLKFFRPEAYRALLERDREKRRAFGSVVLALVGGYLKSRGRHG